jgi:hypothetical protein
MLKKGSGTEEEEMAVQVDLDTRWLRTKTPPGAISTVMPMSGNGSLQSAEYEINRTLCPVCKEMKQS